MPTDILPPNPALDNDRYIWHRVFDPHFDQLLAWGYVDGAYPVSFGSTCTGFAGADGEVAFREGSTKLDFGADLSADTLYIVSSSGSDTQDYVIQGIDANGDYATATVTATGTTPAAVTGTWNHAQRLICTTGTDNVGTVYLSTKSGAGVPITTGDQIQCVMEAGMNYAVNPMLIVPNGQIIDFTSFDFFQDASQSATINIYANRQGRWLLNFRFFGGRSDHTATQFHTPVRFFEGDKMRITVEAGGGTSANASFGMNGNVLDQTAVTSNRAGIGYLFS